MGEKLKELIFLEREFKDESKKSKIRQVRLVSVDKSNSKVRRQIDREEREIDKIL